jgi:aspartate carbamoyltransferase catalytic subunit
VVDSTERLAEDGSLPSLGERIGSASGRKQEAAGTPLVSVQHVLDARQFSREWLQEVLFPTARNLEKTPLDELPSSLRGRRLFYLFYEPSTRTRVSFQTAVTLLGGDVVGMESWEHRAQEERLEDRIQVLNQYPYDFILLRYHEEGGARRAAAVSKVPVINAGDGAGQHPTQALLDAYTIWRELGQIDGLRVALVGDLSYERTTNSLAYLLGRFRDLKFYLVSPHLLRVRAEVQEYLVANGAEVEEARDLREVASRVDVVYMTKAHTSRLEHARRFDNGAGHYAIDADMLAQFATHAIVLHPLPRGPELPAEFDGDPRIACFRQARNGLFVRMALLTLLAQHELLTPA